MITPGPVFKDNLSQLPAIEGVARIEFLDAAGAVTDTIENQPGKLGSLAVYQYLAEGFERLDAAAAEHGLAVFAEITEDARERPGAHPNIDRLIAIAKGAAPLSIRVVAK